MTRGSASAATIGCVLRRCGLSARLALPAAIGAAALLLRLYGLGDKPFWLDEVASLHRATASVPDLVADSLHASHYPSYFLLLWLVARIGASQWLLRLPSAIFGALAAALACATGRQVGGLRSGAVAGLLTAFSPFSVQLGQEARSYTLVSCLILLALWGVVRLVQDPAAAALPPLRKGPARAAWAAYVVGTAAALGVLNVAVSWLFAANLAVAAIAWRGGPGFAGLRRSWVLAQGLVLAAWAPMLAAVYAAAHGAILDAAGWAPAATGETIWSIVAPVYLMRIASVVTPDLAPVAVPGLSLAVAALAALGVWRLRRDAGVLWVLGCAALVPPLVLLLVSLLVPVLVARYIAWSAAPFYILAGVGLGRMALAPFAALTPVLAAACLTNLMPYYNFEAKPRWDLLASELAAEARPGDVVLLNSYYSYSVLAVFAARAGLANGGVALSWQLPQAAALASGHDLWAVYGRAGQRATQSQEDYRRSLDVLGMPVAEAAVGRYIRFWRFRQPLAPAKPNQHAQVDRRP
ncbi:MAG: hypothetical protein ACREET_08825 [Stellaceae bacterium]